MEQVIVCVGNPDRADDGVGPYLAQKLKVASASVTVINALGNPENFTEAMVALKPAKITIVDAARMGLRPGEYKKLPMEAIPEKSFSTHELSLRVVAALWQQLTRAEIEFWGIEPESVEYRQGLSPAVQKGAEELCTKIIS